VTDEPTKHDPDAIVRRVLARYFDVEHWMDHGLLSARIVHVEFSTQFLQAIPRVVWEHRCEGRLLRGRDTFQQVSVTRPVRDCEVEGRDGGKQLVPAEERETSRLEGMGRARVRPRPSDGRASRGFG